MRKINNVFPVVGVVLSLVLITPSAVGQDLTISDIQFGTNPSNSPFGDFLSGLPGNSANDISVGIALENLCGQVIGAINETPQENLLILAPVFDLFQVCFGTLGPVLADLTDDQEFARFVEESAGFLFNVSGREVAALAGGFIQLVPTGTTFALQRLSRLRLADSGSSQESTVAFDDNDGKFTFSLEPGGAAGDDNDGPWRFYVNGQITTGDKDITRLETGYDFDGTGVNAGLDYRVNPNKFVGINLAVGQTDLDYVNNSDAELDAYDATGYFLYFAENGWHFEATGGIGSSDIELSRTFRVRTRSDFFTLPDGTTFIDILSPIETVGIEFMSDTDADRANVTLGVGRDVSRGSTNYGFNAKVDFLDVDVDGYTETPSDPRGDGLALEIDNYDIESIRSIIGASISRSISTETGVFVPYVRVEWIHEFEDDPTTIQARFADDPLSVGFIQNNATYEGGVPAVNPVTGQPDPTIFVITADNPDQDYFQLGLGSSVILPGGTQMFVALDSTLELSNFSRYSITAGVSKEF